MSKSVGKTNRTEFVDEMSSIRRCQAPMDFPSPDERYGIVGAYLGHTNALFCGGMYTEDDSDSYHDCYRY